MTKFPISPIFIPANKLDYIDKALNSGADGIIFDLEDSILQEDRDLLEIIFILFLRIIL